MVKRVELLSNLYIVLLILTNKLLAMMRKYLKENLRANFMDRPKYMPAHLVNSGIGLIWVACRLTKEFHRGRTRWPSQGCSLVFMQKKIGTCLSKANVTDTGHFYHFNIYSFCNLIVDIYILTFIHNSSCRTESQFWFKMYL